VLSDVARLGWRDGMEFCLALPELAGVVAIPAQAFYDDQDAGRHLVRWAFCKDTAVLEKAIAQLRAADLEA
jgi:N-succinyldiaminopimelate aminotransferase